MRNTSYDTVEKVVSCTVSPAFVLPLTSPLAPQLSRLLLSVPMPQLQQSSSTCECPPLQMACCSPRRWSKGRMERCRGWNTQLRIYVLPPGDRSACDMRCLITDEPAGHVTEQERNVRCPLPYLRTTHMQGRPLLLFALGSTAIITADSEWSSNDVNHVR